MSSKMKRISVCHHSPDNKGKVVMATKLTIKVGLFSVVFLLSIHFTHQEKITCFDFENNEETCWLLARSYTDELNTAYIDMQQNPDLHCRHECVNNSKDAKICRSCFCATDYQLNANIVHRLTITVIDPHSTSQETVILQPAQNYSYYKLFHRNMELTTWPHNMCSFMDIVSIDLSRNKLEIIPHIGCLSKLSVLVLFNNRITHVANTTFVGLHNLRVVDISFNRITSLDPETFTGKNLPILIIDVRNNNLNDLDVTNIILDNPFCFAFYSNNRIGEITRKTGWLIDMEKEYGSGFVELNFNNLKFIDFFVFIGDQDVFEAFAKLFYMGFDVRDNKWVCDCRMVPLLLLADEVILTLWRKYFDVQCYQPRQLSNHSIPDLVREGKIDLFVCNITERCPEQCRCFNKSSENIVVVDCIAVGLTDLPKTLPLENKLEIYLQNNNIQVLDSREYLKWTSLLNISNNSLTVVTDDALDMMKHIHVLDLQNNNLQNIPRTFQNIEPCSLRIGTVQMECDCEDLWIKDWLRLKQCYNSTNEVKCKHENNESTIMNETMESLNCDFSPTPKVDVWVIVVIFVPVFLIVFVFIGVYKRRFEIFLLWKLKFDRGEENKTAQIFISFDEQYDQLREWVTCRFNALLNTHGIRTFVPCINLDLGGCREEETIKEIQNSHVIVILSNTYFEDQNCWTHIEWKYAWKFYRQYRNRKLLLVTFDSLESTNFSHRNCRAAKAFLRLKLYRDVSIGSDALLQWISEELKPTINNIELQPM